MVLIEDEVTSEPEVAPRSNGWRDAVAMTASVSVNGVCDAARYSPRWFVLTVILNAIDALIPAAQVWLLAQLVLALDHEGRLKGSVMVSLIGLILVLVISDPVGQIAATSAIRIRFQLMHRYTTDLAHAAARLRPVQLADPETLTSLESAQKGVGYLAGVPRDALEMVGTVVTATALCVTVCSMDLLAGIFVMAAMVPTVAVYTYVARHQEKHWPEYADASRYADYAATQLVRQRSGTELAIAGTGAKVARIVERHALRGLRAFERIQGIEMRWQLVGASATGLLVAGAVLSMVAADLPGGLTAAAVAGVVSGLSAVRAAGYAFGGLIGATPHARFYRTAIELAPPNEPVDVVGDVDRLAVRDLTITYPGAPEPAVVGVNLHARRGEMIALVGVNGAGKTTTINAILGALSPDAGVVEIDGVDVETMNELERLAHFGLLTQEFGRYEFTVRETVGLGDPRHDVPDSDLDIALETALAAGMVRSLPGQVDSQLGAQWEGVGLSGGQWQRLALARVALRRAGIWILDEPTSAIDAEAEREIFAQLLATRDERITIVVSHRAWTLRGMDRIYVFDEGRIVQRGTYDELLDEPGRFAQIFADQV
ncbi:putative ABC transporter, permease/ATP-binding protein [Nocardioidaceae bacterium Broad-1]|nr:putative ABC transporter, permease/ATP-binding protein [Nocardioidaceae bacterium Broad-1]